MGNINILGARSVPMLSTPTIEQCATGLAFVRRNQSGSLLSEFQSPMLASQSRSGTTSSIDLASGMLLVYTTELGSRALSAANAARRSKNMTDSEAA